jgi:hypothetical protein
MAHLLTAFDDASFDLVDSNLSAADGVALNECTVTTLAFAQTLHRDFVQLAGHGDSEAAIHGRRVMVVLWKTAGVGMLIFPAQLKRPSDAQLCRAFKRLIAAPQPSDGAIRMTWDEV